MPRKIQAIAQQSRTKALSCMGDSITANFAYGVRTDLFYPNALASLLYAQGIPVKPKNFGISGNTTTQMLARLACMTQYEIPDLAVIYGGINDSSNSISLATTEANIVAMTETLLSSGIQRVIICSRHYYNFTATLGDNLSGPVANMTISDQSWVGPHVAATTETAAHPGKVAWCDLYAYFYAYLIANPSAVGQWSAWHVADGNIHLSALGESLVASAIYATIQAQPGWLTAL